VSRESPTDNPATLAWKQALSLLDIFFHQKEQETKMNYE
jgi:hypothetical protein